MSETIVLSVSTDVIEPLCRELDARGITYTVTKPRWWMPWVDAQVTVMGPRSSIAAPIAKRLEEEDYTARQW